jgi:alkyl hydroperoxide reductase subunit AhpC
MALAGQTAYKATMDKEIKMPGPLELNRAAPDFHAKTDAGVRELSSYHGQWLALMYCPRGSCGLRAECLEGLHRQTREIAALGGRLLILHPSLGVDDQLVELALQDRKLKSLLVGTVDDPEFLKAYQVRDEDDAGHGVTGVFLIDPQGTLRAAARYSACAPAIVQEIAELMRIAIGRFGSTGKETRPFGAPVNRSGDVNQGCVEWFQYR